MATVFSPPEIRRLSSRHPSSHRVRREKTSVSHPKHFLVAMSVAAALALWMILQLNVELKAPMLALFAVATLLGSAILLQRKAAALLLGYMMVGAIISVGYIYLGP